MSECIGCEHGRVAVGGDSSKCRGRQCLCQPFSSWGWVGLGWGETKIAVAEASLHVPFVATSSQPGGGFMFVFVFCKSHLLKGVGGKFPAAFSALWAEQCLEGSPGVVKLPEFREQRPPPPVKGGTG